MLLALGVFVISASGVCLGMPAIINFLRSHSILDVPNARSSHVLPVPRGGGIGILIAYFALSLALLALGAVRADRTLLGLAPGLLALGVLGFLDDLYGLRIATRIIVQGVVAGIALAVSGLRVPSLGLPMIAEVPIGSIGWLVAWLWLVSITNVFNFMDGINGLAGVQGAIGAAALAVMAAVLGDQALVLQALIVSGACVGFLRHNLPGGRVFMGDVGSLPLGFFFGYGVLQVAAHDPRDVVTPALAALLFWPFLFDATLTLLRRLLRRESLGTAHREHLYQLLVRAGLPHAVVTRWYAAAALLLALLVLSCMNGSATGWTIGLYMALGTSGGMAALVLIHHRRRGAEASIETLRGSQTAAAAREHSSLTAHAAAAGKDHSDALVESTAPGRGRA